MSVKMAWPGHPGEVRCSPVRSPPGVAWWTACMGQGRKQVLFVSSPFTSLPQSSWSMLHENLPPLLFSGIRLAHSCLHSTIQLGHHLLRAALPGPARQRWALLPGASAVGDTLPFDLRLGLASCRHGVRLRPPHLACRHAHSRCSSRAS